MADQGGESSIKRKGGISQGVPLPTSKKFLQPQLGSDNTQSQIVKGDDQEYVESDAEEDPRDRKKDQDKGKRQGRVPEITRSNQESSEKTSY